MAPQVKIRVVDQPDSLPQTKGQCDIALCLKRSDSDILAPKVDRVTIEFSRKSTNKRYSYLSPTKARNYVDGYDAYFAGENPNPPRPFLLELTEKQLEWEKPRRTGRTTVRKSKSTGARTVTNYRAMVSEE